MKISDTTFENNPTYFTNPPFLWEVKSEPPPENSIYDHFPL